MNVYFGENLKRLRKEKELTQETLADFLGVSFQAVSKWERDESYPDLSMLPVIASFFDVTADELLGVDKSRRENQIENYLSEYEKLYLKDTPKAFEIISMAKKDFPGDFRILIRYMACLLSTKGGINNNPIKIFDEMVSINENIQNYCTSDSIRIKAKRLMGTFYKTLSYTEKDDSYIEKMEKINADLPVMRDSRDYTATHMYPPGEKHDNACRDALEELLFLLDGATVNFCYFNDDFSFEQKIKAAENTNNIFDIFYDDGNYGNNWHYVIYNYGYMGYWYSETGNAEKSLVYLRKAAELAKKYDEMPKKTILNSHLLSGSVFEKKEQGRTMCERMKHHFTVNYPLSDEFKNTEEFKAVLDILG